MLRIISESLPRLVARDKTKQKITRAKLYEVFTDQHFQREAQRLEKQEKDVPAGFDFKRSFKEYSEDLAVQMFLHDKTSVETESVSYVKKLNNQNQKNDFGRFFTEKEVKVRLARRGCQLTELDGLCKFNHKSIQEYFVATTIFEQLSALDEKPNFHEASKQMILSKIIIVNEETEVYKFLVDLLSDEQ